MRGDLSFVSGQVRALEAKLLQPNQLDRMVGAPNFDAAFSVFLELQYAEYIDQDTKATEFESIIETGLYETKELLQKGAGQYEAQEQHQPLNFLWLPHDVNNLKRALKLKLVEGATELLSFTPQNGFSQLGIQNKHGIEEAVFRNHAPIGLPLVIFTVVQKAEQIYREADEFLQVEYALDKALGEFFFDLRERVGTTFFKKLVRHWADITNFRHAARSLLMRGAIVPKETWVSGGNIAYYDIEKCKTLEELMSYTQRTKFAPVVSLISDNDPTESMYAIERYLDHFYMDYLKWEALGASERLSVLIHYFERRVRNAQMLKFVMYGKFHGLDADTIYKRLAHF